jgi:hypothetical protein
LSTAEGPTHPSAHIKRLPSRNCTEDSASSCCAAPHQPSGNIVIKNALSQCVSPACSPHHAAHPSKTTTKLACAAWLAAAVRVADVVLPPDDCPILQLSAQGDDLLSAYGRQHSGALGNARHTTALGTTQRMDQDRQRQQYKGGDMLDVGLWVVVLNTLTYHPCRAVNLSFAAPTPALGHHQRCLWMYRINCPSFGLSKC